MDPDKTIPPSQPPIIEYKKGERKTSSVAPTVKKALGDGGYGTIYQHREIDNMVVKKSFNNLEQEFTIGYTLDHSSLNKSKVFVIKKYDDSTKYKIVMDKINGKLVIDTNLDAETAIDLLKQAKDCCRYLYGKKVFWKDINPGNIFLTNGNSLKICDFGAWDIAQHAGSRAVHLLIGAIEIAQNIIEQTKFPDKKAIVLPKDFFDGEQLNIWIASILLNDFSQDWIQNVVKKLKKLDPSKYPDYLDSYFDSVINELKKRSQKNVT